MRRNLPILIVAALILIFAGCSRQQTAQPTASRSNTSDGMDATPSGKQIFSQNCAGCHGNSGELISGWKSSVRKMSEEQVETVIRNGRDGMPSFKNRLSDDEIDAVAKYAKTLATK